MKSKTLVNLLFIFSLMVVVLVSATSVMGFNVDNEVYEANGINGNSCMKHSNGDIYCVYETSLAGNEARVKRCDSNGLNCGAYVGSGVDVVEVYNIFERHDGKIVTSYKRSSDTYGGFTIYEEDLSSNTDTQWSQNGAVQFASCFQHSNNDIICSWFFSATNSGLISTCNSDGGSCVRDTMLAGVRAKYTSSFERHDGKILVGYMDDAVSDRSEIAVCDTYSGSSYNCVQRVINSRDSATRSCYQLSDNSLGCTIDSPADGKALNIVCDSDGLNCGEVYDYGSRKLYSSCFVDSFNNLICGFSALSPSYTQIATCDSSSENCELFNLTANNTAFTSCFENGASSFACGYRDSSNSNYGTLGFLQTSSIILTNLKPIGDIINKTDISFNYEHLNNESANITVYLNDSIVCTDNNVANGTDYECDPSITDFTTDYEWYANIVTASETLNTSTYAFRYLPNEIHFEDEDTNPLVNITIDITYPDSTEVTYQTDSNGNVTFPFVINDLDQYGDYELEVSNNQGYQDITIEETVNTLNAPLQENYMISNAKVNVNIYNRETLNLLTGVDVELILFNYFNVTTNNGTYVIENQTLLNQEYTLQAVSDGYYTEQSTFTFNNQEVLNIDYYMLNLTGTFSGFVFTNVLDQYYRTQANSKVELLEYNPAELGYIKISECFSNSNGECQFLIELGKKNYIIRGSKAIDGVLYTDQTSEAGEIINTENEVRQLFLKLNIDLVDNKFTNTLIDVTTNGNDIYEGLTNTSQVSVNFQTKDGLPTTVCIDYYILNADTSKTNALGSPVCVTSSSGVANPFATLVLNRSNNYELEIYETVNNLKVIHYTEIYKSDLSFSELLRLNNYLNYVVVLLFILALIIALSVGQYIIFPISAIILAWFSFNELGGVIGLLSAVFITVIGLLVANMARKKEELA